MEIAEKPSDESARKGTLVLQVRYAPVKKPMVDNHADDDQTLAQVKAAALAHFDLAEGPVAGGSKVYQLSFDDVVQTDLGTTLGELAHRGDEPGCGHGHGKNDRKVELLLIEQFVQG
jgi:hypothetical protein